MRSRHHPASRRCQRSCLTLLGGMISPFRAAGIPAFRIYERDSHAIIHTPDDQPERHNYTLASECAKIVAGMVVRLDANGD